MAEPHLAGVVAALRAVHDAVASSQGPCSGCIHWRRAWQWRCWLARCLQWRRRRGLRAEDRLAAARWVGEAMSAETVVGQFEALLATPWERPPATEQAMRARDAREEAKKQRKLRRQTEQKRQKKRRKASNGEGDEDGDEDGEDGEEVVGGVEREPAGGAGGAKGGANGGAGYERVSLEAGDVGLAARLSAPGAAPWTLLLSDAFEPLDGLLQALQNEQVATPWTPGLHPSTFSPISRCPLLCMLS